MLSLLMFNIYINDLVQDMKELKLGVLIKDDILHVLLYADELCVYYNCKG